MNKVVWLMIVLILLIVFGIIYWFKFAGENKLSEQNIENSLNSQPASSSETEMDKQKEIEQVKLTQFKKEGQIFTDDKMHNFEVIKLGDGKYRMFYHRGNQIMSAISNDGKDFQLESGARLNGSMPATVQLPDGRWRMYFSAGQNQGVKSAISNDGFTFQIEDGWRLVPGDKDSLDEQGQVHLSILRLPDDSYKLFFDGVSPNPNQPDFPYWTIMSAKSTDGLNWIKDEGSRIVTNVEDGDDQITGDDNDDEAMIDFAWSSHAQYKDSQYILYFGTQWNPLAKSGIYRAISKDGLNFSLPEPVLLRDTKFGDQEDEIEGGPRGVPQDPFILSVDGEERLFYWLNTEGIFSAIGD